MGPKRCSDFKSKSARFDDLIAEEKYKSIHHPTKRVRAAAWREWQNAKLIRDKALSAHVDCCQVCDPPQAPPVRCRTYTQFAEHFDRQLEGANQQMSEAEGIQEKTVAQIAINRATNGKEVVLIAHIVDCSLCE